MNDEKHQFKVSSEELNCLKQAVSDSDVADHKSLILIPEEAGFGRWFIQLSRTDVEQLSDALSHQLAKIGFEDDYSLTREGQMLEHLIDKFFVD